MKKIFAVLLLLAMTLCAAVAGAEDHVHVVGSDNLQCNCGYYGSCGDGVEWELVDGTLTISKTVGGTGAMEDYTSGGAPWYDKRAQITSVVIGDDVTSIGEGAFWSCWYLTNVTIPDSVTEIGTDAFMDCSSLTSMDIPEGVTSIGQQAFYNCKSLESVTIPASVTSIGGWAFASCTNLTTISVPWNWTGPEKFYKGALKRNNDGDLDYQAIEADTENWLTVTRGPAPALPTTGDSSSLALWLALLMLAALGAAAMRKRAA